MRWAGWWWCGACLAIGCGGVSPSPEEMAAHLPPERTLDAAAVQVAETRTAEALARLRSGEFGSAREAAEAAIDVDPRAARAHAVLSRCLMEEARAETPPTLALWRQAEGELRIADRLLPLDPEIGLMHAEFLEADGHLSAAAAVIDRVLAEHPDDVPGLRAASRLHYELSEERKAATLLQRLLALDPNDHIALYRLARCELRQARTGVRTEPDLATKQALYATAIETFGRYRQAVPADAEGFSGEAYARFEAMDLRPGEPDAQELTTVAQLYRRAAELDPTSPEPLFNLGVVLEAAGDAEGARRAYEEALARDPEHLAALLNLAAHWTAAERPENAVTYCKRALALRPSSDEKRQLEAFLQEHDH